MQPLARRRLREPGLDRGEAGRGLGREPRLKGEQERVRPQQMAHQQVRILGHRRIELADRIAAEPEHVEQCGLEAVDRCRVAQRHRYPARIACQHHSAPRPGDASQTGAADPTHDAVTGSGRAGGD